MGTIPVLKPYPQQQTLRTQNGIVLPEVSGAYEMSERKTITVNVRLEPTESTLSAFSPDRYIAYD